MTDDGVLTIPDDRRGRIELAAALLFGRRPGSLIEPEPGWIPRLARAMCISDSAVRATLELDRPSPPFDRKLIGLLRERRRMMIVHDAPTLSELAAIIESGDEK